MESTTDVCQSLERHQILRKKLIFWCLQKIQGTSETYDSVPIIGIHFFPTLQPSSPSHTSRIFFLWRNWRPCHSFGVYVTFSSFPLPIYTNHTAVKAVLESENSTAKYGWGVTNVRIKQEERTRPRSFRQPSLASTCCRNWGRMKLRFPPLLLKASGETVLPNIFHQCHTQFVWQPIRDKEWSTHLKELRRLTRPVWDVRCCCWLSDVSTEANSLNYPSS